VISAPYVDHQPGDTIPAEVGGTAEMLDRQDDINELSDLMEQCAKVMDTLNDLSTDVNAIRDRIQQHMRHHK
jgi:hypothetical protein